MTPGEVLKLEGRIVCLSIGTRYQVTRYSRAEQRLTVQSLGNGRASYISVRELSHAIHEGIAKIES